MTTRQLLVLGTASQAPTRYRNHNGYLLRWDDHSILFDPGEGTQRQMLLAGVSPSRITDIALTHLHGDHCLGLPGIIQRLSLDSVTHPVDLYYPAEGQVYVDRLRRASAFVERAEVRERPISEDTTVEISADLSLTTRRLEHSIPAIGYRLDEAPARRMLPERLQAAGIEGPAVGELAETGELTIGGRRLRVEDFSAPRPSQSAAFIMDTRLCDAAFELAEGVDLLVCESTFLESEAQLASEYGHMTAAQAARLAARAQVGTLVLTHFSQRHPDSAAYLDEALPLFARTVIAHDLACVPVPPRRPMEPS